MANHPPKKSDIKPTVGQTDGILHSGEQLHAGDPTMDPARSVLLEDGGEIGRLRTELEAANAEVEALRALNAKVRQDALNEARLQGEAIEQLKQQADEEITEQRDRARRAERLLSNAEEELEKLSRAVKPTLAHLAEEIPPHFTKKDVEALAAALLKKAGIAGKRKTGRHVAKHAFMRDPQEGQEKAQRIAPGTVLDDLAEAEIEHLTAKGAIEPEYE